MGTDSPRENSPKCLGQRGWVTGEWRTIHLMPTAAPWGKAWLQGGGIPRGACPALASQCSHWHQHGWETEPLDGQGSHRKPQGREEAREGWSSREWGQQRWESEQWNK